MSQSKRQGWVPRVGYSEKKSPPNALQQSNCALSGSQLLQGEGCVTTSLEEVMENWARVCVEGVWWNCAKRPLSKLHFHKKDKKAWRRVIFPRAGAATPIGWRSPD